MLPPYHLHREMNDAIMRLSGVLGRLSATLFPETLVTVCMYDKTELRRQYVGRGYGGASHGICPPVDGQPSECELRLRAS